MSNENGITTYCAEVTVLFTGVDELEEQEAIFKVFVHVDQSMVQVEIDINFIKNSQLVLYNALGQVVKREAISSSSIQFSTDGLANGTYFLP